MRAWFGVRWSCVESVQSSEVPTVSCYAFIMGPKPITAWRFRGLELFVDTADREEIKVTIANDGHKFIDWIKGGHAAIDDDGNVSVISPS
jgi:hypothetical protein